MQIDEAAVLETALRSQLRGKQVVDMTSPDLAMLGHPPQRGGQDAVDAAIDGIIEQLGEEEALRN